MVTFGRRTWLLLGGALVAGLVHFVSLSTGFEDWNLGALIGMPEYMNGIWYVSLLTVGVAFLAGKGGFFFIVGGYVSNRVVGRLGATRLLAVGVLAAGLGAVALIVGCESLAAGSSGRNAANPAQDVGILNVALGLEHEATSIAISRQKTPRSRRRTRTPSRARRPASSRLKPWYRK